MYFRLISGMSVIWANLGLVNLKNVFSDKALTPL